MPPGRQPMAYKDACIVINGGNHNEVVSDKIQFNSDLEIEISWNCSWRTVTEVEIMLLGKGKVHHSDAASCTNQNNLLKMKVRSRARGN
ncbi:unnamed protein product [Trifolium pratense]|uniref:Uncharacterized protein n=1 Tax=Trifolium pratense TaxID=57577 RepID=A0ACB0LJ18_TRIPR|nr:unnamed protein product [Trifolium pratense]